MPKYDNQHVEAPTQMRNGGALGNIDEMQGHPGGSHSPGPEMKPRIPELDVARVDTMKARKDGMPERAPGTPWWGHSDKTSPWWAK